VQTCLFRVSLAKTCVLLIILESGRSNEIIAAGVVMGGKFPVHGTHVYYKVETFGKLRYSFCGLCFRLGRRVFVLLSVWGSET
jgi:hypothetical protein